MLNDKTNYPTLLFQVLLKVQNCRTSPNLFHISTTHYEENESLRH